MCRFTFIELLTLALSASAQLPNQCDAGDENCAVAVNANVMLQKNTNTKSKQVHVHEKKEASGASIFTDGVTPMQVGLHPTDVNPTEMLLSFDIASNDIEVTNDTVLFPVNKLLQASFIRRYREEDDEEVGVLKQIYASQPNGASLSPAIRSGVAEKLLVLKRKKTVDQTAYARANSHGESPLPLATRLQLGGQKLGLLTTSALLSKFGSQTLKTCGLPDAGGTLGSNYDDNYESMKSSLATQLGELQQAGQLDDPEMAQTNCMHWTAEPSANGAAIEFTANQQMATFRGETTSAPFSEFGVNQGISFVRVENGRVNMYYEANTHGHFPDPLVDNVSPAVVKYGPGVTLISTNPYAQSPVAKYYFELAHSMPHDYGLVFLPQEYLCPSAYAASVQNLLSALLSQNTLFKVQTGTATSEDKQLFATAAAAFVPCTTNFLKPVHINGTEYGVYVATAMIHGIMDYPPDKWFEFFARQDWNDIDTSQVL